MGILSENLRVKAFIFRGLPAVIMTRRASQGLATTILRASQGVAITRRASQGLATTILRASQGLAIARRASQGLATTIIFICTMHYAIQAGGLSTAFAELKIENISPGESYPLTGDVHRKFSVKNTSSMKIKLQVEVALPGQDELKEGYEPFPASEFIVLERSIFELEPGESAETEVFFTIPKKKEYYGKKYQVYLWSHTIPEGGISVAVGLKSRFLLHTVERPKGFFRRLFGK